VTKRVRLGSVVGLLALTVALLPLFAGTASATPVTGAAFTTTNTDVDGTGHCKNGHENVNCNIYDGKEFVWLNGGPSTAYVGDGDYFFAVLEPGGQGGNDDPNDGTPKNLSDDFDTYTDRTFTVSGGSVAYGGPHDFDSNKIRLMPYADTSNPGGVYILAICSLADDYPVNPSDCKYDAFKIQKDEAPNGLPLTIVKDADGSFNNTYAWTIDKAVDKTLVKQVGGNATFTYTVTSTHDGGTISAVKVNGKISVYNPNVDESDHTVPVDIDGVSDTLSDGTSCTVTNGGPQTLTTFQTDFPYECNLSGLPQGELDNVASVSWSDQFLDNGANLAGGTADFTFERISFTENTLGACTNLTDTFGLSGQTGTTTKLGQACVDGSFTKDGSNNLANFTSSYSSPTFTFMYDRSIPVPQYGCASYDNTASFKTIDTGATGSSSETVTVCGPARTGALTIGFWKGPNGNSLIKNYCAPSGTSLAAYLSSLGSGFGPFTDAAGKSCTDLVAYINGILNGASATNMNNMLKAQMLGTALDVYFSTETLGYSTTATGSGKNQIKPPSTFLSVKNLGTFKMDTTAVCPMVDNLSTGTATCIGNKPSTDAVAAGAVPSSPMSMQAILGYAATTPTPFNGLTSGSVWYGGDRTKEEILKNIFDQFNNQLAFGSF
jgi:hypothetical protein